MGAHHHNDSSAIPRVDVPWVDEVIAPQTQTPHAVGGWGVRACRNRFYTERENRNLNRLHLPKFPLLLSSLLPSLSHCPSSDPGLQRCHVLSRWEPGFREIRQWLAYGQMSVYDRGRAPFYLCTEDCCQFHSKHPIQDGKRGHSSIRIASSPPLFFLAVTASLGLGAKPVQLSDLSRPERSRCFVPTERGCPLSTHTC